MIFDKNDIETKTLNNLINFENKDILEFCCGTSMYANRISQNYKSYLGVDINSDAIKFSIEQCKNKNAQYCTADITDFHPNKTFDITIGTLALHEIDIKLQGLALKNIISLTKQNGLIVLLDPVLDRDSFQELWNIVYREFISFEHDYTILSSEKVIKNEIKNKTIEKINESQLKIPIEFKNNDELYNMFLHSKDFKDTFNCENNQKRLKTIINKYLQKISAQNLIYDKLKLIILKRR